MSDLILPSDDYSSHNSPFNQGARVSENISGEVLQDNAQANGVALNRIRYSVYDAQNTPMPGVWLDFQTTGSAVPHTRVGFTNSLGQYTVLLTNLIQERVLISAYVRGLAGVDNHTYLNFTSFLPQYRIVVVVITNNSLAGQPNIIRYYIYDISTGNPVPGVVLNLDDTNQILRPPLGGITNSEGWVPISMISNIPGRFTIKIHIGSEPLTVNSTDLTWV